MHKSPIIKKSYGIICSRYNLKTKKVEFLLIKKKTTFYYAEFILKYYRRDDPKLIILFNNMSYDEKLDILSLDFSRMWYRLFVVNPEFDSDQYYKYSTCKTHFEKNFIVDKGQKLKDLICRSQNYECIWEIPKGRKLQAQEKDMICAMREFKEETGVSNSNYMIIDTNPIKTSTVSFNVKYINHLYLSIYTSNSSDVKLQYDNIQQLSEVSRIDWMDIDKVNIIDQSGKLYSFLKNINKLLRKRYKIQKLTELNLLYP